VKDIYSFSSQGYSIRRIAREVGCSRNTVRKYIRSEDVPRQKPRAEHPSLLEQFKPFIHERLAAGIENCAILLRELEQRGYTGSYTILKDYVKPFRQRNQTQATMRFETEPGEQAQVDWGSVKYTTPDGKNHRLWVFVMVLSWSRMMYVEFVRRADVATFIRCHLNALSELGIPRRCLYDNAKTVVLRNDANGVRQWNQQFLEFALRMGIDPQLCRPYRAQTKGKVESGVKYVKRNFWPAVIFTDLPDLNQQRRNWLVTVANVRIHGTTGERPVDRFEVEKQHLRPFPGWERVAVYTREQRKVGRDGYVHWDGSYYGVPWQYAGQMVQVESVNSMVEIWQGENRIAVHPRALRRSQFLNAPGQWAGLNQASNRPRPEPVARQLPDVEVERRSLAVYDRLVEVAGS